MMSTANYGTIAIDQDPLRPSWFECILLASSKAKIVSSANLRAIFNEARDDLLTGASNYQFVSFYGAGTSTLESLNNWWCRISISSFPRFSYSGERTIR
jgi:hypothetical protein